ncbi:MAG TPA: hypothetical protein EYG27_08915 [Dehalococcoidia bacterium]|nr:hypothetical protein [Dehalococcoidia bacterium]HIL31636.1 hypothetical protein [Dehalococcoidia bacterium]
MSTRLGIELAVEPAFTARAYRTRNIVCGQYASWAAEMNMLRMSVISYFPCSDSVVDLLAHGVGRLAEDSRKRSPRFSINCLGVANGRNGNGSGENGENNNLYLDFKQNDINHPVAVLHREAAAMIEELPGASLPTVDSPFHPKINLMEYANLPPTVMADAADFAKGVAIDVGVPVVARAWRLVLLRYLSDAAGDDWSHGSWSSDVRWEYLSSYVL